MMGWNHSRDKVAVWWTASSTHAGWWCLWLSLSNLQAGFQLVKSITNTQLSDRGKRGSPHHLFWGTALIFTQINTDHGSVQLNLCELTWEKYIPDRWNQVQSVSWCCDSRHRLNYLSNTEQLSQSLCHRMSRGARKDNLKNAKCCRILHPLLSRSWRKSVRDW